VADPDAALTANHVVLTDEAVVADPDARVRNAAEVVDVQHGAVHDERALTDADAVRTGVEVDGLVDVRTVLQLDVRREPDADAALDGRGAPHREDRAVGNDSRGDAGDRRDPPECAAHGLLQRIARRARRLAPDVEPEAPEQRVVHGGRPARQADLAFLARCGW